MHPAPFGTNSDVLLYVPSSFQSLIHSLAMDSSKFRSKRFAALFASILLNSGLTNAATFFTDASQLPATVYDFIVVGGTPHRRIVSLVVLTSPPPAGNAGNVVAARLTEDCKTTVLLIEAGISYVLTARYFPCN